jgi:shikimate 5-dehydrogenase
MRHVGENKQLAILGAGGTSLAASFTVGMGVLRHLTSGS